MSHATSTPDAPQQGHDPEHDPVHEHNPHLAHHFDTPLQQFDAGKLGLWLFLTTEVLMFSGLFCAYAVYRANHPEIFEFADRYLDWRLGALNTIVLIFSSFTMAWGVRAAQLGQTKLLVKLLAITLVCGGIFMVVKAKEYYDKFDHGTLLGQYYNPKHLPVEHHLFSSGAKEAEKEATSEPASMAAAPASAPAAAVVPPLPGSLKPEFTSDGYILEQSQNAPAAIGPRGPAPTAAETEAALNEPKNVQIFFSIYFIMTGLHGVHVLVGMGVIAWLLVKAMKGQFGPDYFAPVDFTGLYWHLVDLVWIFLFPLLYLIHA